MLGRILAVLLVFVLATSAHAEPKMMGVITQCDDEPGKVMQMVQERYNELPFSIGEGVIQNIQGAWIRGEMLMFVNPSSGSYSIILREPATGVECLLLAGGKLRPATGSGI